MFRGMPPQQRLRARDHPCDRVHLRLVEQFKLAESVLDTGMEAFLQLHVPQLLFIHFLGKENQLVLSIHLGNLHCIFRIPEQLLVGVAVIREKAGAR